MTGLAGAAMGVVLSVVDAVAEIRAAFVTSSEIVVVPGELLGVKTT